MSVKVNSQIKNKKYSFLIVKSDEENKWNEIVKRLKNYDVYYLLDYVKAFNLHGDGEPILFYYEDECIKALNVVMKRDISLDENFRGKINSDTYFDISTPYGYGGFIIEGEPSAESLKNMEENYVSLCQEQGIISEFVRFHPVLDNAKELKSIYVIQCLGKTVTVDLDSREKVWDNFIGKNRNVIRKSIKSEVEIFWGRSPNLIEKFLSMYNATMDKDNAQDYYYFKEDFYNSILNDLKYNSMIFYAVYEKKIIAMSMILYSNVQVHYHLSASDRVYQRLAPSNLLLYEVACWASENGYKTFHLGGGLGSKEDGLYSFKKVFNKNSNTTFSIGKKIFNQEKYEELLSIRKEAQDDINSGFFPAYRG